MKVHYPTTREVLFQIERQQRILQWCRSELKSNEAVMVELEKALKGAERRTKEGLPVGVTVEE